MLIFHEKLDAPFWWYEELEFPSPYTSSLHAHSSWQLTVAIRGGLFFDCHGERIYIAPGGWIMFSPMVVHQAVCEHSNSSTIQMLFRHFPQNTLPEFSRKLNFLRNFWITGTIEEHKLKEIMTLFREVNSGESPVSASLKHLLPLNFIMATLGKRISDVPQKADLPVKFFSLFEYMEEHINEPLGVPEFAAFVNLSESRFSTVFRQLTGASPMHYFNDIRLCHAQRRLLAGDSLREVTFNSGFSSIGYFCRKFKKYTGKTPREFCADPSA